MIVIALVLWMWKTEVLLSILQYPKQWELLVPWERVMPNPMRCRVFPGAGEENRRGV